MNNNSALADMETGHNLEMERKNCKNGQSGATSLYQEQLDPHFQWQTGRNEYPNQYSTGERSECGPDSACGIMDESVKSRSYDQNLSANEKSEDTLSKLPEMSCHLVNRLKNEHRFYEVTKEDLLTNSDLLDLLGTEHVEYFAKEYKITNFHPVFMDDSGFVFWILDKDGCVFEWNEMTRSMKYMGNNLSESLTNFFFYPDKICYIMETGERVPTKEFDRRAKESRARIRANRANKKVVLVVGNMIVFE